MCIRDRAVRVLSVEESAKLGEEWSKKAQGQDIGYQILNSRFIHTDKTEEEGTRAKSRWCVVGYQEESLEEMVRNRETDAPTPGNDSKMIALQVIASRGWELRIGDISGAFLNTEHPGRRLYVRSPKSEPIPGLLPGQLVELTSSVYGLNTAPLAWFT